MIPLVNPGRIVLVTSIGGVAPVCGVAGQQRGEQKMRSRPQEPAVRPADFEALYERHSREVWALAYARWMNAETAQDIMQEAFLRLWKQGRDGTRILNPRAWLLRVARNLAEDYAKSAFSRNGTQPPQTMNGVQAKGRPPLERLEQQETFAQVRAILKQMPEADREILTLRYALDYDSEEIAEVLAIQVTAVHMRLSRARQRLAERLSGQGIVGAP